MITIEFNEKGLVMKKLSLIFLFAFLLIIIGCSEDNTSPSRSKEENEFLSKTHPNLSVAVRNNVPEDMIKPTIGILGKDRTETFANVVYIISEKSVFYQFEYDGEVWARNDYEHVRYHMDKPISKITTDSPKLGKLYSGEGYNSLIGDKLIIENLENIDYSGYFSSTSYGSWVYDDHKNSWVLKIY